MMQRCRFQIDLSTIVRTEWSFIAARPNTWSHKLSSFIDSGCIVKKLQMHMKVEWDWENLQHSVVALVRRCPLSSASAVYNEEYQPAPQHWLQL
jgi:hypothetical protein